MDTATGYALIVLWLSVAIGQAFLVVQRRKPTSGEPETTHDPAEREELIALFEVCAREITFIKGRQWNAVYYSLLAHSALVWVRREEPTSGWQIGLMLVVFMVGALALGFLLQCDRDRAKNKERMVRCARRFTKAFNDARDIGVGPDRLTAVLLIIAIAVGTALTALLVLAPVTGGR